MSASKSPTHSLGAVPSKRRSNRRTRSVCSASSNTSMRLTAAVEDSFQLSPMPSRMSVLNDKTDIQEPGRQSWWRRIGENSRRVTEIMEERDAVVRTINVADEFDVEVLSQENENVSIDLPESSDGESIHSIVLERRQMFVQEVRPVKKTKEFIRNKENLVNSQKSYFDKTNNVNIEKDIDVMPKKLFNAAPRPKTKPVFTAALINASANKTVSKSPEQPAQEVQVRNLFRNRPNAKRKNNFAAFLLSDSEDEIPDVQPRMFGFQKTKGIENQQISKQQRRSVSQSSVRSSISNMTDVDMEQWKQLPSSTMLEDHFELVGITPNKTRLSRLSKSRQSGVAKRQSNSINKSRNSNQSHKSDKPNLSKKSNQSKISNANNKTTLVEGIMQVDEVIKENFTLKYDDDDDEEIFDIPGKAGNKNQEQNVIDEERKEIQQVQNQIQGEMLNEKENQEQNESERVIVEENKSEQVIEEENESEGDIEEENESEQEIEEENGSEQESEGQNESDQEIEDENDDQENEQELHVLGEKNEVEEQNQIRDEGNKTEIRAENKSEHEILEVNKSGQENQQKNEKSNEEETNNKNQENIQFTQIKEKSYYNSLRNNGDEYNIVKESGHKHNQNEYQRLDCSETRAPECEKDTENVTTDKDEQEHINPNENLEININNIADEPDTEFPEAVIHDKSKRGETFAALRRSQESEQMHREIDNNNKDEQDKINSNENKQVDNDYVGNIEDEQDAKSPEAVLHDKSKRGESFDTHRRRTSTNKSKTMIKDLNIRPSLVPARESIGLTDGSLNSSAEGSGWDSHRTTRKTLRQTFGKDFTPRKSLRTLVMERTAKRQTQNQNNEIADVSKRQPIGLEDGNKRQTNFNDITSKMPLANSTEFPAFESYREDEVSLTSSAREPEKSKMAIVNSSILREPNKEKEQVEKLEVGRKQNKDEHIELGRESEQDEEIQLDTEQDEEVPKDIEQNEEIEQDEEIEEDIEEDEEIEPDIEEDEEIEPDTEQNEEIESDEAQEDEELESHTEQHQTKEIELDMQQDQSEEIDSDREHQTKDIESDGEQEPDEEMETSTAKLVEEYESYREPEETLEESDNEISINSSQDRSLQTNVQKIMRENAEKRRKIEEQVMKSLNEGRKPFNLFKMPEVPKQTRVTKINQRKPTKAKPKLSPFFTGTLPPEFLEDMKYKPPKRFTGKNAPWITKRLYKYLEEKLEPKYDYRARVRAECLVEKLYYFAKDVRKRIVAPRDAVSDLKREMATLGIVNTHYDFYCFFHDFMPREIRIRVNPDVLNNIPADRRVFGNILGDDEA